MTVTEQILGLMKLWCGDASFHSSCYSALFCSARDWRPLKLRNCLHIMLKTSCVLSFCICLFLLSFVKSHKSVALLLISDAEVQLVLLKIWCDSLKETTHLSLKSDFKWKVNCILSWIIIKKEPFSFSIELLFEFYWKGVPQNKLG